MDSAGIYFFASIAYISYTEMVEKNRWIAIYFSLGLWPPLVSGDPMGVKTVEILVGIIQL